MVFTLCVYCCWSTSAARLAPVKENNNARVPPSLLISSKTLPNKFICIFFPNHMPLSASLSFLFIIMTTMTLFTNIVALQSQKNEWNPSVQLKIRY
ncbi:hypothetical protein Ahy_B01g052229 isoform C [Arachis hypogaea]|uniref:Uncharacterized protein n=1 Tax=Arachis hypogaea TaxID=3818 RepID=A0A445ANW3_ARAHY|nr:hypothetical protein Ahy_B01g052229 isoform C [Arachis hypogaea]